MRTLETDTFSTKNIYTGYQELAAYTASGSITVRARVLFTSLAGAYNEYDTQFRLTPSGGSEVKIVGAEWSMADATEGRIVLSFDIDLESGDALKVYGKSSNSSDTSVGGSVKWFATSEVDATAISGDGTAADNLEAMLDGTGATLTLDQLRIDAADAIAAIHVTNSAGKGAYIEGTTYGVVAACTNTNGTGMWIVGGNTNGVGLEVYGDAYDISADIQGNLSGAVNSVVSAVTADAVSDKTGYALAADGLDSISTTAPAGVASNFREMLVQVWRRFFRKSTMTATELKTYADNGTDVVTTQTVSEDGTTQTQGAAS